MRKMHISKRDVILIVLASLLDGRAVAKLILELAGKYIDDHLLKTNNSFEAKQLSNAFRSLEKDRLVVHERKGIWKITEQGKDWIKDLLRWRGYIEKKTQTKKKDTIIIFDIPEQNRKKRLYLRIELRALGFEQLQKSVWIGTGPIPEPFIRYLHELRLLSYIHIFTINARGTLTI